MGSSWRIVSELLEAQAQETPPPFEGEGVRSVSHSTGCICGGGGRLLLAVPGKPGRVEAPCPYGYLDVNQGRSTGRAFDMGTPRVPRSPANSPTRVTRVTPRRIGY